MAKWPQTHTFGRWAGPAAVCATREHTLGRPRSHGAAGTLIGTGRFGASMEVDGCPVPEDRLYDLEQGTWITAVDDAGVCTLGLTSSQVAFAGVLTSLSFRELEGSQAAGTSVATVESVRFTGPVRLPIEATVVERNPTVVARPKLVNDSPYDRGWIVRVRPSTPVRPGGALRSAPEIVEGLRERIRALHIRCYAAFPDLQLIELGTECSATLARLDDELAGRASGEVVLLVTDDPTSPIELVRWSDRTGHTLLIHRVDGHLHEFLVRKEPNPVPRRRGATGRMEAPATNDAAGAASRR
ncbi:MAG TPA: sulfurtransferase TusA family protein [Thermoplasmata archaeon]|nr:sulfurtransferase TusA family protein [Thermoplasmata archaeon]